MTLSMLLLMIMVMVLTTATIEVVVPRPLRGLDDPTQPQKSSGNTSSSSISIGAGSRSTSSSSKVHGHNLAPGGVASLDFRLSRQIVWLLPVRLLVCLFQIRTTMHDSLKPTAITLLTVSTPSLALNHLSPMGKTVHHLSTQTHHHRTLLSIFYGFIPLKSPYTLKPTEIPSYNQLTRYRTPPTTSSTTAEPSIPWRLNLVPGPHSLPIRAPLHTSTGSSLVPLTLAPSPLTKNRRQPETIKQPVKF